jgi:hypothetical protein
VREDLRAELEVRGLIAMLLVKGHAVYHPDDLDLPPDERRLVLTEEGERERDRLLGREPPE